MKILYIPIPEDLKNKRTLWGSHRDKWLNKVQKEEEFYYSNVDDTGTIFTKKQLGKIDQGSGIPVSINFSHPIVNQKLAILTRTNPTSRVVALDNRGKKYAAVLDKILRNIMYSSEAIGEEEETIKNMLVLGMGISGIDELDYYQFGRFNIEYVDIHPSLVILDSNCKKRNLSNMEGYFIEKEITLETAKEKFGLLLEKINQKRIENGDVPLRMEQFATSAIAIPRDRGKVDSYGYANSIVVSEYYSKYATNMYYIKDIETGDIKRVFRENLEENQDFILANALDSEYNRYIKKTLMLGDYIVAEKILPIRDYKIKVKFFEWGGKPYNSFGMIHFIKGMQEASDKAIQLMLINGMLTNNAGYLSPTGGILPENKSKWETIGNKPGAIKEWNPQIIDGQLAKPEREIIQPISNFYPTIIEMMKSGMQFSTGVNEIVSGDPSANIDVFSSLQQYQNAAMERIQLAMRHINLVNEQLGNVLIDYIVANLNPNQNYAFFDDNNEYQELTIANELIQDFKLGRYLVLSIASEAMPSQKIAMGTELMKIAQTTTDPMDRNIFIQKAFELSDMRGFDDVQEKIDIKNKLSQQVQNLSEENDRLKELNKQYENKTIAAEIKAKISDKVARAIADVGATQTEANKDIEIEKLKAQLNELKQNKKE